MPTSLPLRSILDGSGLPSTSAMKTALGQLRDYLSETLGDTGGSSLGFKNRLVNGAMKIDQRNSGNSQTIVFGADKAYTVDRWYAYNAGYADNTGQRIALSNKQNRYRLTGSAGATTVGFGQRIEAANCMDMAGSTATLQAKLSSTNLTSLTWQLFYANTTNLFGTVASPTRTLIASGSFTISTTEATYSTQISIPAAATTGLELLFTGGTLSASNTLTIGDVQLENNSIMTPFEQRPAGVELALCQRHCLVSISNGRMALGYMLNTTSAIFIFSTPVTMYGGISLTASASGTPRIATVGGFGNISSYSNIFNEQGAVSFSAVSATSLTAGAPAHLEQNGSTLTFQSEL